MVLSNRKKNRKFAIQQLYLCKNIKQGAQMPESPIVN
jgi:hypothetical protein